MDAIAAINWNIAGPINPNLKVVFSNNVLITASVGVDIIAASAVAASRWTQGNIMPDVNEIAEDKRMKIVANPEFLFRNISANMRNVSDVSSII